MKTVLLNINKEKVVKDVDKLKQSHLVQTKFKLVFSRDVKIMFQNLF